MSVWQYSGVAATIMSKKRYTNKKDVFDAGEITALIHKEIPSLAKIGLSVEMNNGDGSLRDVRFDRSLTTKEETKFKALFPELTEDEDR